MNLETQKKLISSYVNGTLKPEQKNFVESTIGSSEILQDYYLKKLEHKDFLKSLIPAAQMNINIKRNLEASMREVNQDIFPKEKFEPIRKIYKFLTTPIIEI